MTNKELFKGTTYDSLEKQVGGNHSTCGENNGFCIMSNLSQVSFLNNVLLS